MPTREKMQEVFQNMMNYLEIELPLREDLSENQQNAIRDAIGKVIDIQKRALEENEPDMPGLPACSDYNDAINLLVSEDDFEDGVPADTEEELEQRLRDVTPSLRQGLRRLEVIRQRNDPLYGLKITTDFHGTSAEIACGIANNALERLYSHYLVPRQMEREAQVRAQERQQFLDNLTPRGKTALNVLREFTGLKADQKPQMEADLITLADFADGKQVGNDAVQQALTRIKEHLPSSQMFQPTFQRAMQITDANSVDQFFTQIKDYTHTYYSNLDSIRAYEQAAAEQEQQEKAAAEQKKAAAEKAVKDMAHDLHEMRYPSQAEYFASHAAALMKREWLANGVPRDQITDLSHRMADAYAVLVKHYKENANQFFIPVVPEKLSAALDTLKEINDVCHMDLKLPDSINALNQDAVLDICMQIKGINDRRREADHELISAESRHSSKLYQMSENLQKKLHAMSEEEIAQYIKNLTDGFALDLRAKNKERDPEHTELTEAQKQAVTEMNTTVTAFVKSIQDLPIKDSLVRPCLPTLEKLNDQYQLELPPLDSPMPIVLVTAVLQQMENISDQRFGELSMPDMTPKNRAQYIRNTLNGLVAFNHPDMDMDQAAKLANTFANLAGFIMNQPDAKSGFVRQGVETLYEQYPQLKAKYDNGGLNTVQSVTALLKDCFEIEKRNLSPVNRKNFGSFDPFTAEKVPYAGGKPAQHKQPQKQAEKQAQQPQMGH